jgi:SNF2 family DNA or RNA helicase
MFTGIIRLPCGAGKSVIGIGSFLEARKIDKNLKGVFVVKASLKDQWYGEISKFSDLRASVIQTFKSKTSKYTSRIKSWRKKYDKAIDDPAERNRIEGIIKELMEERKKEFFSMFNPDEYDIYIANYETIVDDNVRLALHKLNPQFWYVDEVDCIKSNATKRSKAIYEFNDAKYRFGATATPIRKNPKDLFGIFSFVKPDLFPSEREFDRTYLRFYYGRVSGSQNEEQLASIVSPYIFKRTFEQIADQLPQQSVYQLYCDFTPKQQAMWNQMNEELDEINEEKKAMFARFTLEQLQRNEQYKTLEDRAAALQTFAQMLADSEELLLASESNMAHQYVTGDPSDKVRLCMELLEKIIASGEKVCIFSRYLGIQDILAREIQNNAAFNGIGISRITGATTAADRTKILKEYNTKSTQRILLLSDSGEAGLNLSTTRYMIEFELADSAAKQTQRHGRIQRADSIHKNVFVYQLLTRNSWDDIAMQIVNKKQGYAERILT